MLATIRLSPTLELRVQHVLEVEAESKRWRTWQSNIEAVKSALFGCGFVKETNRVEHQPDQPTTDPVMPRS